MTTLNCNMLSAGGILLLKHTYLAIGASVAFHTGAFVGINFINARSSVLARMTVAFLYVCNKTATVVRVYIH